MLSLISLILEPPLPMREPHCEAGTISLNVIGGFGTPAGVRRLLRSSSNLWQMRVKALSIAWLEPDTVTIRSGHAPSVMLILAPLCNTTVNTHTGICRWDSRDSQVH